jgi:hypothetical protein
MISHDQLAWLCIIGFAGIGSMLLLISVQVRYCIDLVLRVRQRPPGYRAVEYYEDGKIKHVEYAPPDGVVNLPDRRHNPD